MALLLDRGRFGVALDHNHSPQHGTIFAGHFLPGRLATMGAERNCAAFRRRSEQDAPAVLGHADIIENRPAFRIDADGGAQIDELLLKTLGPHVVPPIDITGVPLLQRALDALVLAEPDVVGDQAVIVDCDTGHGYTLSFAKFGGTPLP